MKSLFVGRTQSTAVQFVRYLLVGGTAAVLDSGTLYFLYRELGVNHLVAGAIGFVLGLIFNYLVSIAWVFESKGNLKQEFMLFGLIGAGGLCWTELILWASVDVANWPVMVGKIIALGIVLVWNFGMRKKFVFGRP